MKSIVLLVCSFVSLTAGAQSKLIEDVFRRLPPQVVFDLNLATRDSLLQGRTYYPADNDSESVVAFNYGSSTLVKDYMFVSMSYETRQRASAMVELRSFEMNGKKLVVVSECGGVEGINYQQNKISAFLYDRNKRLTPFNTKLFPGWSEKLFIKPGTPNSVKEAIFNNSNLCFDFSKAKVLLLLNSPYLSGNKEYRKWLKGDRLKYRWTGKRFVGGQPAFL